MKFWEAWVWSGLLSFLLAPLKANQSSFSKAQALKTLIGRAHQSIATERPAPKNQQTLKLSVCDDGYSYKNLNPYWIKTSTETGCLANLFERLIFINADGKFQGACAEKWEYDRESFTWTFQLQPNLKWNDGTPLTTQDFVRGIRAKFDAQTYPHQQIPDKLLPALVKNWNLKEAIELLREGKSLEALGVWAPNTQTLKLQWAEACNPEMVYDQFVAPNCIPLHPQYLELSQTASKPADYKKLVTNGPFQLVSLLPGSGMTLKKNPYFWEADNVQLESKDELASVRSWQRKEVDISEWLACSEMQLLTPSDYEALSSYASGSWIELQFNLKCPKLQDRRVRQAINLILDRNEIEERFYLPFQAKLYGYLEPECNDELPYLSPEWSHWSAEQRLNKAQQLMLEAGYHSKGSLKLKLSAVRSYENHILASVIACFDKLKAIELEIEFYNPYRLAEQMLSEDIELALGTFYTLSFHPFMKYYSFYCGKSGNLNGFQNERYDGAIDALKTATTFEAAQKAVLTLEHILWEETPVIPLCSNSHHYLVSSNVGGWSAARRSPLSTSGSISCRYLFKKR